MYRRIFAFILAFVMVFSLIPATAVATEEATGTEPVATEPKATEPKATEPKATEPKATEPKVTEPKATEPKATEPKATEPKATEPKATEPKATEPKVTEPKATEPKATEPKATEPKATEPKATEPKATEPKATEPKATEPTASQKTKNTNPGKRDVERASVTTKFSFEFPEDSGLTEEDVGSISVVLQISDGEEWEDVHEKEISAENRWTATFVVEPYEDYQLTIRGANLDGYVYDFTGIISINLEPETNVTREYTICYTEKTEDPGDDGGDMDDESNTVTVSLVFAKDSALKDADVGDITVFLKSEYDEGSPAVALTRENGRRAELSYEYFGTYEISFSGLAQKGYTYTLEGDTTVDLYGDSGEIAITVKYTEGESKFTVSLDFAEDSALKDADIGNIIARIYTLPDRKLEEQFSLTQDNGRTASIELEPGEYEIRFASQIPEGYFWNLDFQEFSVPSGMDVTKSYSLRYVKDEAKFRLSLDFAEDSAFQDADLGDITVIAQNKSANRKYSAALTSANGRSTELVLPSGYYEISLSGHQKDGYFCNIASESDAWELVYLPAEETAYETLTLQYVEDQAKLTVSLDFSEDSVYKSADLGDITAQIYDESGEQLVKTIQLTQENGRSAETALPSGAYIVRLSGYEKDGYFCGCEQWPNKEADIRLTAGEESTETFELRYVEDKGKVTLSLNLEDGSELDESAIGTITAEFYFYDQMRGEPSDEPTKTVELTQDNDWEATTLLPLGAYDIRFSGYDVEGYYCSLADAYGFIEVYGGEETQEEFYYRYEKDACELTIVLDFSSDSALASSEVGDITAEIRRYELDGEKLTEEPVGTLALTAENGRTGKVTLPSGSYNVCFENYGKTGYYCTLGEGGYDFGVPVGADEHCQSFEVVYVDDVTEFSVSLDFTEDSALNSDDLGDITAQIYRVENPEAWRDYVPSEGTLVGSTVLTKENGRKGEILVKLDGNYDADEGSGEYGWINTYLYELRLVGMEQDDYRYTLENADQPINPIPGADAGWNVTAKYVKAEHDVTVKVRLSEDSNVKPSELKEDVRLRLENTAGGVVNDIALHPGSTVFTHTFTDLPSSDCYRMYLDTGTNAFSVNYIVTVKSVTGTADVKAVDLEKGQWDFPLNGDCEFEIVIQAEQLENELTAILRFTEDSALKAEDFPDGLKLVTIYRADTPIAPPTSGEEIMFTQSADWTQTIKLPGGLTTFAVAKHPAGYTSTVKLVGRNGKSLSNVNPYDCPTTVYVDVCFEEREPYYLDVELVFAEDSALKGADAGSFFLDVNDNGIENSYEFKEGSWRQTIELYGNTDSDPNGEIFSINLRGLDRAGYRYTLRDQVDDEDNEIVLGCDRHMSWEQGETKRLQVEICYTPEPGKLVVTIVSSPNGSRNETTITVTDADGNVVAEAPCNAENNYQCVIELAEAGTYTISQTAEEGDFADGDKTIQFDPAKGASVTLCNESRKKANLVLQKIFENGSELGPEDFPNGITVTLTESSGAFSGEYVLSDANGWNVELMVPTGVYTASEEDADRDGYERTTHFAFVRRFTYPSGGKSLRPWEYADNSGENTTRDAVGGPYYIIAEGEDNRHKITVYNSYIANPDDPAELTGSITITAADAFYIYEGEKLPGSPGTGYEADEYTYRIVIDGEEQIVNLKPGEEITIDGIAAGVEYTVTPVLPEGYPWNAAATPITGTIGGETNSEEELNVKVSFDNDYYYLYEECALTIVKMDELTGDDLSGAKFGLYSDKACTKRMAVATTGKDGTCTFTIAEAGTYYIKELKAPTDYHVKSEDVKIVTIEEDWELIEREDLKVLRQELIPSVKGLLDQENGFGWINLRERVDISVTKKFKYDADLERPESVTIALYQDGKLYDTVKLTKANNWKYVWEDMPLGFEYTVDELNVAKGYHKKISSKGYDFTVVNSGYWNPQTGDDSMIALWICAATLSLVTLAVLTEKKRRQRS